MSEFTIGGVPIITSDELKGVLLVLPGPRRRQEETLEEFAKRCGVIVNIGDTRREA
jgi:hypothetical protein